MLKKGLIVASFLREKPDLKAEHSCLLWRLLSLLLFHKRNLLILQFPNRWLPLSLLKWSINMGTKDHLRIEILLCWTGRYLHFRLIHWLHVMLNVIFTCIMPCNWTIFYIHICELFPRDNHWTWWSTTAWGYLWYHVNTDFTHTVSGVPCVVEQRTLDCSMRAVLLSPLLLSGRFPFKAKFLLAGLIYIFR